MVHCLGNRYRCEFPITRESIFWDGSNRETDIVAIKIFYGHSFWNRHRSNINVICVRKYFCSPTWFVYTYCYTVDCLLCSIVSKNSEIVVRHSWWIVPPCEKMIFILRHIGQRDHIIIIFVFLTVNITINDIGQLIFFDDIIASNSDIASWHDVKVFRPFNAIASHPRDAGL